MSEEAIFAYNIEHFILSVFIFAVLKYGENNILPVFT